jgi:hypothetical protein
MLRLVIAQFRTELAWLRKVTAEFHRRAPARHPARVSQDAGREKPAS